MLNKRRLAALLISGLSLNLAVPVQIAIAAEGRVIEEIIVARTKHFKTYPYLLPLLAATS
jgi:hypothetical protein